MRRIVGLSAAAVLGGSACVLMSAAQASAQIVNPTWNLPNSLSTPANTDTGTSDTAETNSANTVGGPGWYMSPAANPDFGYTNNGMRDQFYSLQPISSGPPATGWSFWIQTFTQSGLASQTVSNDSNSNPIVGGDLVTFSSMISFQDGTGPGMGYNATTLANQTEASPVSPNTGDLNTYLEMVFLNVHGGILGSDTTNIPAGSVNVYDIPSGPGAGATYFEPYNVSGVAPTGTASVEMLIGWTNGGLDGGTGGQSAFADNEVITVPEPASMSLLALGSAALFVRRRAKKAV
jgi:hypothetical protein